MIVFYPVRDKQGRVIDHVLWEPERTVLRLDDGWRPYTPPAPPAPPAPQPAT